MRFANNEDIVRSNEIESEFAFMDVLMHDVGIAGTLTALSDS